MKKSIFKILTLLLVVAMLFLSVACNGFGKESAESDIKAQETHTDEPVYTPKTTSPPRASFAYPPSNNTTLDFEGAQISILSLDRENIAREWYKATPEDELDEAVAIRNDVVEDTLNLVMSVEFVPYTDEYVTTFTDKIRADVNSDLHEYDMSASLASATSSPLLRGYTANMLDERYFPYFEFTIPCWDQAFIEAATINEQLYYAVGTMNISMYEATSVMWYNHTLYENLRELTDPDSLQELAIMGYWTYDELYKWVSRSYTDDTEEDFTVLALDTTKKSTANALSKTFGLEFVAEKEDGTHFFDANTKPTVDELMLKLHSLTSASGTHADATLEDFASGKVLFYTGVLYENSASNAMLKEMKDFRGILPLPKYDENDDYFTTADVDSFSVVSIIDHSKSTQRTKGEEVSAFIQLTAEDSYTTVRGYYFNRIIKPKYFGTDDANGTVTKSIMIFDMLFQSNSLRFDLCDVYSAQLETVNSVWLNLCDPENGKSSDELYFGNSELLTQEIKDLDAWFGLISLEQ